jgi:hypothetical protein
MRERDLCERGGRCMCERVGGQRDREQKREETQMKRKKEGRKKKDRCNCYVRLVFLFPPSFQLMRGK